MNVGIVGGGFAGFATAVALAQRGHDVRCYEAVADPSPIGAGILLQPTGAAVLDELGLLERVRDRSAAVHTLRCMSGTKEVFALGYEECGLAHGLGVHRGVLFQVLFEALEPNGVTLETGCEITRVNGGAVYDARGVRRGQHDVVVVADGARSALRASLFPSARDDAYPFGALWFVTEDRAERYAGVLHQEVRGSETMIGFLPTGLGPLNAGPTNAGPTNAGPTNPVPTNRVPKKKDLTNDSATRKGPRNGSLTSNGPMNGAPTNAATVNAGRRNGGATSHGSTGGHPIGEIPLVSFFYSVAGKDVDALRARGLQAFYDDVLAVAPMAGAVLERLPSLDALIFGGYRDVVLKVPYRDRTVVIGDAAHAMSPQLGQGTNLALLDALALARWLTNEPNLALAFAGYARERRANQRFYQFASRWLTPFFQSHHAFLGGVRDTLFPLACTVPYLRRRMVRVLGGGERGILRPAMKKPAGDSWASAARQSATPETRNEG
ncbi:MAG: NAD(P)/FAD-dependent oxidoreductase [Myxococcota bacterium]